MTKHINRETLHQGPPLRRLPPDPFGDGHGGEAARRAMLLARIFQNYNTHGQCTVRGIHVAYPLYSYLSRCCL